MKSCGMLIAVATLSTVIAAPAAATTYPPLPSHIYAPYYYLASDAPAVATIARLSGAKYFTLAFLQAPRKGSCTLDWNGNPARPLNYYNAAITSLQILGGNVIPSFGGARVDEEGTEIADSCKSVRQIAADYEQVITTLGVTRLDMDVESSSLSDAAGITRRNEAIAMTEAWANANGIPLRIQYTLPVEQNGLYPNGQAVLRNALVHNAAISSVNIMVFNYYSGNAVVNMSRAAINAATSTHRQLARIYPRLTSARTWNMEAMTMLPGIDSNPKKTEITSLADVRTMLRFATARGMNLLSIWDIQRDNGICPGHHDTNTSSGITRNTWTFTHLLQPFTS